MDGDTRGGSALSVRAVSGKPIKFMGVGEGMFHHHQSALWSYPGYSTQTTFTLCILLIILRIKLTYSCFFFILILISCTVNWCEGMEDLEPFYPERMASRILGMGDIATFLEKAQVNLRD